MELFIPTRLILGRGCVRENAERLAAFGKKALLVTGKNSARKSGALQDVTAALDAQAVSWTLFDEVENNPSIETCYRGGQLARQTEADFIIAIGGGSPMDAAKAIAAYATNDIKPMDIYGQLQHPLLKIVSVPLTAGTGSEVTPYSVLTVHEIENKRTFTHPGGFSQIALLDPGYLETLPRATLLDTVADTLSHAAESMLCRRSTPASQVYAEAALKHLGACLPGVLSGTPDFERLFLASSLAGMAIAHTGTVVVHSMGYLLTYYKDVPHGRANALLLPGFISLCKEHVPERLAPVLAAFGVPDAESFAAAIRRLTARPVTLTAQEAADFAAKAIQAKNVCQNLWALTETEERAVYTALVQK